MPDVYNLFNSELSPKHLAVIQQTKIDERLSGPLLTNIDTMIDTIGTGIATTSAYFALPQRVLVELNEAMVDPLPHDLKRPQLRSFPALMGLFMLLRGSGLAVGETKPKRRVVIDPGMLAQWRSLNTTERFFNLMSCCLYDASWDCVGSRSRGETGLTSAIRDLYLSLRERVTVLGDDRSGIFYRIERSVVACLLHHFGWLRLSYNAKPKPGNAATVRRVERTDFGDAMVFHYDFGDDWRFKVTLEAVDEGKASALKVTAKSGQSPNQYDRY